jgi:CubicO group peptidase (beta-lactamase class C family)
VNFDLLSLKVCAAVVGEQRVAKAAEREHIAASAVGKRIADLEAAAKGQLFRRHAPADRPREDPRRLAHARAGPEPIPEFWSGGGPVYSTARDYLTFLQMLLNGGSWKGARLLKPETVAEMNKNHTGTSPAGS